MGEILGGNKIEQQLRAWRDELIDLTRRNRLLNLDLGGRMSSLEIVTPAHGEVIAGLKNPKGWRFHYPPLSVSDEEIDQGLYKALVAEGTASAENLERELITTATDPLKLSSRLRNMAAKAATEYVDRGLRVLYLTIGMLEWADGENNNFTSPLILIPVVLERGTPREPYRLKEADEDWSENPALALKLQQEFDIAIPTWSDAINDVDIYLALVEGAVSKAGWKVTRAVSLAPLSFAKESMYRDLLENEAVISEHPLVRALADGEVFHESLAIERIAEKDLDFKFPPESLYSILDADSTQRACIIAAKNGNSFVMDGPPGSGKSQTIANIIAELMAAGRSILFVSEKAAALEVVKKRLDSANLGEFVLELHSHKAKRKEVASALGGSLERRVATKHGENISKSALMSRREKLSKYAVALNEQRGSIGRSLHFAIGRCAELGETPIAALSPDFIANLNVSHFESIEDTAQELKNAWGPIDRVGSFLWRDISEQANARTVTQIEADLGLLRSRVAALSKQGKAFGQSAYLAPPIQMRDFNDFHQLNQLVATRLAVDPSWLHHPDAPKLGNLERLERLAEEHQLASKVMEGAGYESGSLPKNTQDLRNLLDDLALMMHSPHGRHWRLGELDERLATGALILSDLMELHAEATRIAVLLGVNDQDLTLDSLERLCGLVGLMKLKNRPERTWLDSESFMKVEEALRLVQPLLEEWAQLESQVNQLFGPNILLLDVESLFKSAADFQANLGRFSSRGRFNRRQLAACTLSGKVTNEVIATLPLVRAWKRLSNRLSDISEASILGSYFEGPKTDIEAVTEAIEGAKLALTLVGQTANTEGLAAHLSKGALDSEGLNARGEKLTAKLGVLKASLDKFPELENVFPQDLKIADVIPLIRQINAGIERLLAAFDPFKTNRTYFIEDILSNASRRDRIAEISNELGQPKFYQEFGGLYNGVDSDWNAIKAGLVWATEVRQIFAHREGISEASAQEIVLLRQDPILLDSFTDFCYSRDLMLGMFLEPQRRLMAASFEGNIEDAFKIIDSLAATLSDLSEWRDHHEAILKLSSLGVSECVNYAIKERLPRHELTDFFERSMTRAWVDHTINSDPRCNPQRSADRDSLVNDFKQLDAALAETAASDIITICNDRRPNSRVGEAAILATEAQKKNKHRSVRSLLEATAKTAQDIKPCFMMSPLAVSHFIPPEMRFDVVIFDEASQVRPCDAINSIYRGKQLIIAGDERQLPPTSFFDRSMDDSSDVYDDEESVDFESVLKLAKGAAGVDELPLRWHYRSRHESLITFSNRMFYNSELITYPSAVESAPDLGVHFEFVSDGVYARGGSKDNRIEAAKVAERVLFHAENQPNLTIGVVAFSESQATRINVEIEALRRERPDLDNYFAESRLDGFFVKNLESVQGDERDIIIFSIGYGHDEHGKLTMNFGPLNKEGGHRRLNVAITRARRRVEVVSSITAGDFDTNTSNRGVKTLRKYLDFAERGISAFADDQLDAGVPESPFEEDVFRCIDQMGYEVVSQVGQAGYRIDMAVRHPKEPGRFVLGIECDGAQYHSSLVARDRDRLRQDVLEGLGWTLHRIWGTSWYRQRNQELDRLKTAIENAIQGRTEFRAERARVQLSEPVPILEDKEESNWDAWARPGSNLAFADLKGAKLSGADLSNSYLSDANLSGADLSGADLRNADLIGAILTGANLAGANLEGSYLIRANLSDANLHGANLIRANLHGANLLGAKIDGIRWDLTTNWPEGFNPPEKTA